MFKKPIKKTTVVSGALVLSLLGGLGISAAVYIPTARDTQMPPSKTTYEITDPSAYTFMTQAGKYKYYFREDRDIFLIEDTVSGANWKTGLDAPFKNQVEAAIKAAATPEEKAKVAEPREDNLNTTYIGFANSLVSVEYFDDSFNFQTTSSAAETGATSSLLTAEEGHYILDVDFTVIDLQLKVHVYCTETGFKYEIKDEDIKGAGTEKMGAVILTPFLGASGGVEIPYDFEADKYGEKVAKPMIPGYVLIPDGSGALVRFMDNTVSLKKYTGSVYGKNPAEDMYYYSSLTGAIENKTPSMPVFGIAHGDNQKAFVAWSDEGAENLEIVLSPEENMTNYTFCYPRFVYNRQIHQVYNRKGEGYFRLFPERNHFNVSMTYEFLEGNGETGSQPANYVGMAITYRNHLQQTGELGQIDSTPDEMPIRLDFLMSDIRKSVVGYSDVVATTANDVVDIINELIDAGITHINGGMLGFQSGGVSTGRPWELNFSNAIGSRSDYENLFKVLGEKGVDMSFSQDYARINSLQMLLAGNQAYHKNRWGIKQTIKWDWDTSSPISEISVARPTKSAEWLKTQVENAKKMGISSTTIAGISQILVSHNENDPTTMAEAIALYQKTIDDLDIKVNAVTPNAYLWKYVDRYLETPVLTTQYIIETDTVPFLQLVLNGSVEMYTPYANFSFYSKEDMLRMIDYNVYPAFILTKEPAHLLSATNSANYYSTEFSLYKDIIIDVYNDVGGILSQVAGKQWINREVIQNGVILNTYDDGTRVLINYTDTQIPYGGIDAPAHSAVLKAPVEGGMS